jgi:hypothetical protein
MNFVSSHLIENKNKNYQFFFLLYQGQYVNKKIFPGAEKIYYKKEKTMNNLMLRFLAFWTI